VSQRIMSRITPPLHSKYRIPINPPLPPKSVPSGSVCVCVLVFAEFLSLPGGWYTVSSLVPWSTATVWLHGSFCRSDTHSWSLFIFDLAHMCCVTFLSPSVRPVFVGYSLSLCYVSLHFVLNHFFFLNDPLRRQLARRGKKNMNV
jgi:hypothetical protein